MLKRHIAPTTFGFSGVPGDLNRFWARYRLAKSVREVVIERFGPETVKGYSAAVSCLFDVVRQQAELANGARGVTAEEMGDYCWVRPQLIATIKDTDGRREAY